MSPPGRPQSARGKVGTAVCGVLLAAMAGAAPGQAHVLSVSQGSLQVQGNRVLYGLRMPLAEVPDVADPHAALLDAVQVWDGGEMAERGPRECSEQQGQELLVCEATFLFAEPPDRVSVRCDFPSVTVAHHIHILRSGTGEVARQTVFDITSREAEIRFTPPTLAETIATVVLAGIRKTVTSPELILFLAALVLAGRGRQEVVTCVAAFMTAQTGVAVAGNFLEWTLPPNFLETAAALTVAYVAAEVVFLPDSSHRWVVCGAMGCFHGLFLSALLITADLQAGYFLPGALGTEALVVCLLGALRLRWVKGRSEQLAGLLLLVLGLGWFGLRLVG